MKIYLDDLRATPDGWERCYKVEEVQRLLFDASVGICEEITNMSLDHDLGAAYTCDVCSNNWENDDCPFDDCNCTCHSKAPTGYDLVKWMAEHNMWPKYKPTVHSANPTGRDNMLATIERYFPGDRDNGQG